MKRALIIAGAAFALIAVLAAAVPPLIDLGAYKARFLPLAEKALERKVDIGEIRLRLVPSPAVRLSGLSVADNPAFSRDPFFTARALRLRLKLLPLLRGRLEVEEFILESPVFNLLKSADGAFNFADVARPKDETRKREKSAGAKSARAAPRWPRVAPARVRVNGGAIALRSPGRKPLKIDGIELEIDDFAAGRPFRYRASFKPAGLDPVTLAGEMIYDDRRAALTLRDNRLKAQGIEFEVEGVVNNLTRTPEVSLSIANDGFEIKPLVELLKKSERLPKDAAASGIAGLRVFLSGPSNNLVAEIAARLQGVEVNDPRAFKGTVVGEIDLAAPLIGAQPLIRRVRGGGRLAAKDGALTNVDLVKRIEQIAGLAGMAMQETGATTFKVLATDLSLAGGVAQVKRIDLENPLIEARGRGRMMLDGQTVDMTLQAALAPAVSARLASARRTAFSTDGRGRAVVPLRISGPLTRPVVNIDGSRVIARRGVTPRAGAVAAGPRAGPTKNSSIFGSLFGTRQ